MSPTCLKAFSGFPYSSNAKAHSGQPLPTSRPLILSTQALWPFFNSHPASSKKKKRDSCSSIKSQLQDHFLRNLSWPPEIGQTQL